jgi:hypothetical protein
MASQEFPDESRYTIKEEKSIYRQTEPQLRRLPDVSVFDKKKGRIVKVYEAGRVESSGQPVPREHKKQLQYEAQGIQYYFLPVRER